MIKLNEAEYMALYNYLTSKKHKWNEVNPLIVMLINKEKELKKELKKE